MKGELRGGVSFFSWQIWLGKSYPTFKNTQLRSFSKSWLFMKLELDMFRKYHHFSELSYQTRWDSQMLESSVGWSSRQSWSRLGFFLGSITLKRTRFGKNLSLFKNFPSRNFQDVNEPLPRQFETDRDFTTLVRLTFLSNFRHKSQENFFILAEISRLWFI